MQTEVTWTWNVGRDKLEKKVTHLDRKWGKKHKEVGTWKGVAIGDEELEKYRESMNSRNRNTCNKDPPVYGGTTISENQKALLKLPPGFTTYEAISDTRMEVELEAMLTKYRWEARSKEQRKGKPWSEEWQAEQMKASKVYDAENNKMEFKKRKVSDIPTCRRITLPEPIDEGIEIGIRATKQRMMDVIKEYKEKYCDEKGRIGNSNLTKAEKAGLNECRRNAKAGKQVFYMTDKSKMISADTPENYKKAMEKHIEGDRLVDGEEVRSLERTMNGHTIMFSRFLRIGEEWSHEKRVKAAMTTKGGMIPELFGLRKDHKIVPPGEESTGPPTRPVCGASSSINGPLSHLLSEILNKVADYMDEDTKTECRSTEEMIAGLQKVNREVNSEKLTIWSSDVKALYPSLKTDEVAATIRGAFEKSKIEIDVDIEELGLYLALIYGRDELERERLGDVTAVWRSEGSRGRRPGITTAEVIQGAKAKDNSKFHKPVRIPTPEEQRKMIGMAIEAGIKVVMKNHTYRFDGKHFLQTEGGPIGLELTGAVSRVYMLWWDGELMRKVTEATRNIDWQLYMYLRYVDDGNCIGEEMPLGARLQDGEVITRPELANEDKNIPGDIRTAGILKQISNSISPFIQVEIDCPSLHDNKLMPILDLEVGIDNNQKVTYQYYMKPMANFLLLMKRSAMPAKTKRVCLVQEVIRILRNTKRELPDKLRNGFLTEFALRMKDSGYCAKFREEVIKSGVGGYEKQIERDESGECPMYRPKGYRKEERQITKDMKKMAWYKPYDTVLFCPPTPGSKLAKALRDVATKTVLMKIKVVEKAGVKLRSQIPGLQVKEECQNEKDTCFIHSNGGKGNCRRESIVYKGTCVTCKERGPSSVKNKKGEIRRVEERSEKSSIYIGESSRSGYQRGLQHMSALEKPKDNIQNAFAKHIVENHKWDNNRTEFKIDIVKGFKTAFERQIWEGVEIHSAKVDILMNSKLDHFQPAVGRVALTNSVRES